MENERFYLMCFASTQKAIYMEKKLKGQYPDIRLVPIPPEISAGCGLGLKIALEETSLVNRLGLEEDIYVVEKQGNKRNVQKLERQ
jgi:hypothetical protein